MTVQTNTNVASFNGNGVTQIFPIAFKFNNDTDLVVLLVDDDTGVSLPLTLNSDYTVSGEGDEEGGLINVVVAPAVGQRLKVSRIVDILQLRDLRNQGKFFAEVHEDALDQLTMIAQQHESGIQSALRVAESDPEPARIPSVAQRAGKIMSFDINGNPQVVAPVTDSSQELRLQLANGTASLVDSAVVGHGVGTVAQALEAKLDKSSVGEAEGVASLDASGRLPQLQAPFGVPIAGDKAGKNIEIIAGVLRQDITDKTKWFWIDDALHTPTGFKTAQSATNLIASGGALKIEYKKNYSKVISLVAVPDDTLANAWGLSAGASVGTSSAVINASISKQLAGFIYWDGAAWQAVMGSLQGVAPTLSYASGTLTVTHEFCPGVDVSLVADSRTGAISPYIPIVRAVSAGVFTVNFIDTTTGNLVTGAASTRMSLRWSKRYSSAAYLDGTNGHDAVPYHSGGNIWVYGIMEV